MSEEVKYQIIKGFGPSVFKITIPKSIIEILNNYIDQIIKDRQKQTDLNFGNNLVGHVTQEFLLEKEIMETSGWSRFLSMSVQKWIELETKRKITKFNVNNSWVVRQFQNEYNPTHWHSGHISGAGFLKVPKNLGEHKQKLKETQYTGGNLQLIHGSKMFLCESTYTIKPEVGDFYFFPNYLMHTVYPFNNSDEERRSISFNANIDNNIYDVYSRG